MSVTVTKKLPNGGPDVHGGYTWMQVADVLMDNSYATGGLSLTAAALGFPSNATIISLSAHPKNGYTGEYDIANSKLIVRTPLRKFTGTLDPASLASVTARDDTVTMTGVTATTEVVGGRGPDALESKLMPKGFRASATDTVTVRQDNPSAAAIDAASGTWTVYTALANMAAPEVASGTDLSAVTFRVVAFAAVVG